VAVWVALIGVGAWRWRPPPPRTMTAATVGGPASSLRRLLPPATVVTTGAVLAVVWPPLVLVPIGAAVTVPRLLRRQAHHRRQRAVQQQLPDVVDLLVVAVAAGLTPTLAIEHLASLAPEPFSSAFTDVVRRTHRGQRLAEALDALPEHLGEAARPLAHTLASTERYGTPVGPALELLAHDARRDRRRRAEEAARTVPVKLCFPLVCCTLPAFVLLTIAPLVAGALRSLRL